MSWLEGAKEGQRDGCGGVSTATQRQKILMKELEIDFHKNVSLEEAAQLIRAEREARGFREVPRRPQVDPEHLVVFSEGDRHNMQWGDQ
jgi:hypothetical protein